jgi:hypothetical protein
MKADRCAISLWHETVTVPQFYFSPKVDINDGTSWSEMDVFDLIAAARHGNTIEEAAGFLCRSGSLDDVVHKARELGPELRTGDEELRARLRELASQRRRFGYRRLADAGAPGHPAQPKEALPALQGRAVDRAQAWRP